MTTQGYKDALISANTALALNKKSRFIGYGLRKGRALGTLIHVPQSQIIEMPVAENLLVGFAIGMAIKGYLPVVFIERMDFALNAADAIVNHLDKISHKSRGEYSAAVILRCVVGNKSKPLFTGVTHTQDHSAAFRSMVSFPLVNLYSAAEITSAYQDADDRARVGTSTMLVEYKDLI